MTVGTEIVEARNKGKYLGVILDKNLSFLSHINNVTEQATVKVKALSRLMVNTSGTSPSKGRLRMSSTHLIVLYGAEIRTEAMKINKYGKTVVNVQS